jgi:hypothetical protein
MTVWEQVKRQAPCKTSIYISNFLEYHNQLCKAVTWHLSRRSGRLSKDFQLKAYGIDRKINSTGDEG